MTETRTEISDYVHAHPGVHFKGLVRALELAPGQVQYHLHRLRTDERVVTEELYGKTHYYPQGYDPWERKVLALLRRETAGAIVSYLLENRSTRPATVADELDIARSTLEWHLDRLIELELVEKQRNERNRVTLRIDRPADTVRLLRDADPTLRNRLVDRFERLVDQFLSE